MPSSLYSYALPGAPSWHAVGPWGTIACQEIRSPKYVLRHFLFSLKSALQFRSKEKGEGLQSLFLVRGSIDYQVRRLARVRLTEKEFALLDAKEGEATALVSAGKISSLLSAYYHPDMYRELLHLFPHFATDLEKAAHRPFHFRYPSRPARYTALDAMRAILLDHYREPLQQKHIELCLQTALFTFLAQTYTAPLGYTPTELEYEEAARIRDLILEDISRHYTIDEIATQMHSSPASIKKLFSRVYGMGIYHFLRKRRMEYARELLLKGYSLKFVAFEVGIQPTSFTKEFKHFFGYTVTQLKDGRF